MKLKNAIYSDLGNKRTRIDGYLCAVLMSEDDQNWQRITPRLVRDPDGWHVTGAPYHAEIKDDGSRLFCPDRNERSRYLRVSPNIPLLDLASLRKISVRSRSIVDGVLRPKIVRIPLPFGRIDFHFYNTGMKFRVLFSRAPLSAELGDRFTFTIDAAGLDVAELLKRRQGVGIPAPRLVDPLAESEARPLEWSFRAGELEVGFDLGGLEFPVTLFNTTIDDDVDESDRDAHEKMSDNSMNLTQHAAYHIAHTTASSQYWAGFIFPDAAPSDTIDVAYMEGLPYSTSFDDANTDIHFHKTASPADFSADASDISGRALTTNFTTWAEDGLGIGSRYQTDSLVTPLQELVDAETVTKLCVIFNARSDAIKALYTRAIDSYPDDVASIHIEHSAAAPSFIPRIVGII